jgi:hypothetical protein
MSLFGYRFGFTSNANLATSEPPVPGAALQLDASDASSISLNGSNVVSWADRIGGLVFNQLTPAFQPVLVNGSMNELPSIQFSKTQTQYLDLNPAGQAWDPTNYTIFISLIQSTSVGVVPNPYDLITQMNFLDGVRHNLNRIGVDVIGVLGTGSVGTRSIEIGTVTLTIPQLYFADRTPLLTNIKLNASASTSSSAAPNNTFPPATATRIGAFPPPFTQNYLDGFLGEILIYERILTGGEITTLEAYFRNKWGTP